MIGITKRPIVSFILILFLGGVAQAGIRPFNLVDPQNEGLQSTLILHCLLDDGVHENLFPLQREDRNLGFRFEKETFLPEFLLFKEQRTPSDAYSTNSEKLSFLSISFSCGMSFIDGGDLNRDARDAVARYEDLHALGGYWNTSKKQKEMKWMSSAKGEIILRLFNRFGVGFGAEYISKTAPGNFALSNISIDNTDPVHLTNFYTLTGLMDRKLTVIPITLNLHYSIPISRVLNVFLSGGAGYYMGKITDNVDSRNTQTYLYESFGNGGNFEYSYVYGYKADDETGYEVKSNTIGFQAAFGFDLELNRTFSLIAEGSYRIANFKDWKGSLNRTTLQSVHWELNDGTVLEDSQETIHDAFDGTLWFYEYTQDELSKWYGSLMFSEEDPESHVNRRNFRPAEININGFVFRIGIKIRM